MSQQGSQVHMDAPPLSEEELNEIYNWVDTIPLTRPKKHIARDFADGVLLAEIMHNYVPKLIELHNYSQAHSMQQKQYNWSTLNSKVFRKMGFQITQNDVDAVINCAPEAIERVLKVVQVKIQLYLETNKNLPSYEKYGAVDKAPQNKQNDMPRQKPQPQQPQPVPQSHINIDKDIIIQDQRETIEILELKIQKLEQLVKLKDSKIQTLINKLQQAGIK